jgi:hypothetical protein
MMMRGELNRFIPGNFSGLPTELCVAGGKVTLALLDSVQISLSILDSVRVAKGILEDLYQASEVGEVDGVDFHIRGNLVQSFVVKAVDR